MPNTIRAIAELPPNVRSGSGSHLERRASLGSVGEIAGDVEFRPSEHSARDINPSSLLGEVFGIPHVREVERGRPVITRLIVDAFDAKDHPGIAEAKRHAAQTLAEQLHDGIGETSDRLQVFAVGDQMANRLHDLRPETISSGRDLVDATSRGLVFVVSDRFRALQAKQRFETSTVIGVKLNHPTELALPAGIGIVSVGGYREVNTSKPTKLARFNEGLAQRHTEVVESLETAGAQVATILTDYRRFEGYDVPAADAALARAITTGQKA